TRPAVITPRPAAVTDLLAQVAGQRQVLVMADACPRFVLDPITAAGQTLTPIAVLSSSYVAAVERDLAQETCCRGDVVRCGKRDPRVMREVFDLDVRGSCEPAAGFSIRRGARRHVGAASNRVGQSPHPIRVWLADVVGEADDRTNSGPDSGV